MNWESADDPALVLPRVNDVHGTLTRIGFVYCAANRVKFYRQFVPLFDGGVPAQFVSRNISHISIVILVDQRDEFDRIDNGGIRGRLWIKYGYPERYPRGKKIIEGFKPLLSEETYCTINLSPDRELREVEKSLTHVIDCVRNKRIDLSWDVDSENGVTKKELPPWEAVVLAVQQTLCSPRVRMTGDWWIEPEEPEPCPDERSLRRIAPAGKYTRLPNFDRRRSIRRFVRRPI